jgi:hypothetical protein
LLQPINVVDPIVRVVTAGGVRPDPEFIDRLMANRVGVGTMGKMLATAPATLGKAIDGRFGGR